MTFPLSRAETRRRSNAPNVRRLFAVATILMGLPTFGPIAARAQNESLTYGYSNLFDGTLEQANGFSQYEMILAVEEGLGLWAQYIPLDFIEQPDGGSVVNDTPYSDSDLPQIRIGHHEIDGNTLAHAYSPGGNGLSYDVHMDSSSRTWNEQFFLTVVTHELGHSIGIDHIEGPTALMNASLGAANGNLLPSIGLGFLFQADIDAAQAVWGSGTGSVFTERIWTGGNSNDWAAHENWDQGWRPSPTSSVFIQDSVNVALSDEQAIRSLTVGGGVTRLEIKPDGQLRVDQDVALGTLDGGQQLVSEGDSARTLVPTNGDFQDDWPGPDFDDQAWLQGETGVGFDAQRDYRPFIGTDVRGLMQNRNSSLYTRIEFDVENPADLEFLALRMRYDDGFVAYLNGVEIAAANLALRRS